MEGKENREKIIYFLLEFIPHIFLNITQCKQLLFVKHRNIRDEFHKLFLGFVIIPLLAH
jgi:hypothetical protein